MWVVLTDTATSFRPCVDVAATVRARNPLVIGLNRDLTLGLSDEICAAGLALAADAKSDGLGYVRSVNTVTNKLGRERAIDIAIAAALAIVGLAELWSVSAFDVPPWKVSPQLRKVPDVRNNAGGRTSGVQG